MTNEEAIYYIERMPKMFGIYGDFDNGKLNELKSIVKENTKFKAEIERLKSEKAFDFAQLIHVLQSNKENTMLTEDEEFGYNFCITDVKEYFESLKGKVEE